MKADFTITAPRSVLRDALAKLVALAPAGKLGTPILGCVRLSVSADSAEWFATNIDTAIAVTITVHATADGIAAIPLRRLAEILGNFPAAAAVTIAVRGTNVTVTAGRARFELTGLDPKEMPTYWGDHFTRTFTVPASLVLDGIARVAPLSAPEDHGRRHLTGVLLEGFAGDLIAVATDGTVLARLVLGAAPTEINTTNPDDREANQFIIPRASIAGVSRAFAGLPAGATMTVHANRERVRFVSGAVDASVRLVEGPYPKYDMLMPARDAALVVVCDRAELSALAKRVGVVAGFEMGSETIRRISLRVDPEAREITIASEAGESLDKDRGSDVLAVESCRGEGVMTIGMNAGKLLATLDVHRCERVELGITSDNRAIGIRDPDDHSPNCPFALVMPLRLN